jgi:cellulose biosynthesis protein BcsQ
VSFDFLEKIPEFLKHGLADLAKVFIGAFLVGFMAIKWVKSIRKATKAQNEAERQKLAAQLAEHKAEFHGQLAELKSQLTSEKFEIQQDLLRAQQANQHLEQDRERLATELAALQKRLTDLETFDGRLWERENVAAPPAFLDMTQRKARLIAVMNLKGGVGKTTLTANLGVTLARQGHRVLMVDLDFQGSLSRLCLNGADRNELVRRGLTASRLLEVGDGAPTTGAPLLAQRVRSVLLADLTCDVICASEDLAEAELRAQARWLVTHTPDARFLLRQALHRPEVVGHYDIILFDCPPRLTTACINALGCCDFLLVPVLLEQGSVDALPRTLAWLSRLPHVSHARLLGVVANRVEFWREQLIAAQQTLYNYLPQTVQQAGHDGGRVLKAVVRNKRSQIEEAANQGRIAAGDDSGLEIFVPLAAEIEQGVKR